jgi:hypothetical protein
MLKADSVFTMRLLGGLRVETNRPLAVCARRNASVLAVDVTPLLTKRENAVEGGA